MENCKHIGRLRPKWNQSLLNPQKWMCYVCGTTESVWACLLCPVVACGRFTSEHALKHFQESKHPLSIEVNEKYVYCYECDDYVLNDNASGDLKLLRSTLMAITTQSFTDVESRGKRLLRSYSYSAVTSSSKDNEDDKLETAKWHYSKQLLGKVFTAWHTFTQEEVIRKQKTPPKKIKIDSTSPSPPSPFLKKWTLIPGITGLRNLGNTCYMNSVLQVLSHLEDFCEYFIKLESSTSRLTTPERTPLSSPCPTSILSSASSTPTLMKRPSGRLMKSSSNMSYESPSPVTPFTPLASPMSSTPSTSAMFSTPLTPAISSTPRSTRYLSRQTTVECFKHLMTPVKSESSTRRKGGLSGGSTDSTPVRRQLIHNVESRESSSCKVSLCQELNGLFRVLWSGRWAQVSPHAFLQAVWQMIPVFKGHAQHDAQEFLCELLDKVRTELETLDGSNCNGKLVNSYITDTMFQGELVSQVTCLACGIVSERLEPYLDLSLEFPERYQITTKNSRIAEDMCHVTEMLAKFTDEEMLEGKIYQCEKCNNGQDNKKSSSKPTVYTEAKKRLLVKKLPSVLRLHLKRFRWSGRLHREKINTHVAFNDLLDMKPFCDLSQIDENGYEYKLKGVIMHHGRGFGSGHYTAFCWNNEANSWVNCNDSRIHICEWEEVVMSQAYILFYIRQTSDLIDDDQDLAKPIEEENFASNLNDNSADLIDNAFETQDSESLSQKVDNEITFIFKTPDLISNMSRKRTSMDPVCTGNRVLKRRRSTFW